MRHRPDTPVPCSPNNVRRSSRSMHPAFEYGPPSAPSLRRQEVRRTSRGRVAGTIAYSLRAFSVSFEKSAKPGVDLIRRFEEREMSDRALDIEMNEQEIVDRSDRELFRDQSRVLSIE